MLGSDIVSRARVVLNDADAVRWTDDEFVMWINDACKFIALLRPDSCVVNQAMTCAAGTKQSIGSLNPPGLRVLDVVRNLTTNRAVRLVDRETLDTQRPDWHSGTQSTAVTNWSFDNRDPKTFYVYPPSTNATSLEVVYSRNPVQIANAAALGSTTLSIDDIYLDPALNYVLYRAYSKDADFAQNATLAAGYRQLAETLLGVKVGTDAKFSPPLNTSAGKPKAGTAAGGV